MNNGVLAGYPVDNMQITLTDGSFHAVDSDALSFELCAKDGLQSFSAKVIQLF